jgi:flagellar biosynthesis/type III secretory pathway protein FliH
MRYVAGSNWLGVGLAALMRVPRVRKAWLRSEGLRRVLLECRENEYRRFLLRECLEAYLELDEQQQREYEQLLQTEPYKEIGPMMTTTFERGVQQGLEQGLEQGLQQGRLQGLQHAARLVLERRFGPLSAEAIQRLNAWPVERLEELLRGAAPATSLKDLGLEDE